MSTSDTPTDPDQLRAEIAQTRAELGSTVEALAAKVDVKTRAKQAVVDAAGHARQKFMGTVRQTVQAVGSAQPRLMDPSGAVAMRIAPVGRQAVALKGKVAAARRDPQLQVLLSPVALVAATAVVTGAALIVVRQRRS